MKEGQYGGGGGVQGAEAESQGKGAQLEGCRQGGETSDKSIEITNRNIMLI